MMSAVEILSAYFEGFQGQEHEAMLGFLIPEVIHDIHQGRSERGIEAFRSFLLRM